MIVGPEPEIELTGGRITPGVVRVGDTVRRPRSPRSGWIVHLLTWLEEVDFPYAPRFCGIDDRGRDIFSYVPGGTTDHPGQRHPDAYRLGGQMLRQLHDLTRDHPLIKEWPDGSTDAVCILHGDPGAYNTIFQDGLPVALIDWDAAHPGHPVDDLAYLTWTWCIQSSGNVPIPDQAQHVHEMAAGYGADDLGLTIDDLLDHVIRVQHQLVDVETRVLTNPATPAPRKAHARGAIAWAEANRDLLERNRPHFSQDSPPTQGSAQGIRQA